MSLAELALLQVFSGLSLNDRRRLILKLLEESQLVTSPIPEQLDERFVKFVSREFTPITFEIYEKMDAIWDYVKQNIAGATRIRNNMHLIVWCKPDENYKKTDNAVRYKDHNMDSFLEDGHPRGLLISYNGYELTTMMEVFNATDPINFLKEIGW